MARTAPIKLDIKINIEEMQALTKWMEQASQQMERTAQDLKLAAWKIKYPDYNKED